MATMMMEPPISALPMSMDHHDVARHSAYRPRKSPLDASPSLTLDAFSNSYTYPSHHHGSFTESLNSSGLSAHSKSTPVDPALLNTASVHRNQSSYSTSRESVDSGYSGSGWVGNTGSSQRTEDMNPPATKQVSPITAWSRGNNDHDFTLKQQRSGYTQSHNEDVYSEVASETNTTNTYYSAAQTAPTYSHSHAAGSISGDAPIWPDFGQPPTENQWSSRKIGAANDSLAGIGGGAFPGVDQLVNSGGVSPNSIWNPSPEEREAASGRTSGYENRFQAPPNLYHHPTYQSHNRSHSHSHPHSHSHSHSHPHKYRYDPHPKSEEPIDSKLDKPIIRRRRGPQPSRETFLCPLPTCRERNRTFKTKSEYRRHLLKHHRPFICPFHFAGCPSVFSAKNEWHRHLISIHAYHETYQCKEPKCAFTHGTFNRKDLFKAHLLRTHKLDEDKVDAAIARGRSPPYRKSLTTGQLVPVREEEMWPTQLECGFRDCVAEFRLQEGEPRKAVWDKWIEHRSKHCLKVETMQVAGEKGSWVEGAGLKTWAFDSGFVVFDSSNERYRVNMR